MRSWVVGEWVSGWVGWWTFLNFPSLTLCMLFLIFLAISIIHSIILSNGPVLDACVHVLHEKRCNFFQSLIILHPHKYITTYTHTNIVWSNHDFIQAFVNSLRDIFGTFEQPSSWNLYVDFYYHHLVSTLWYLISEFHIISHIYTHTWICVLFIKQIPLWLCVEIYNRHSSCCLFVREFLFIYFLFNFCFIESFFYFHYIEGIKKKGYFVWFCPLYVTVLLVCGNLCCKSKIKNPFWLQAFGCPILFNSNQTLNHTHLHTHTTSSILLNRDSNIWFNFDSAA